MLGSLVLFSHPRFNTLYVVVNQENGATHSFILISFNTLYVVVNPREYNTYINYNNPNIYIYQHI